MTTEPEGTHDNAPAEPASADWLAAIEARLARYEVANPGWHGSSTGEAHTHGMLRRLLAEVRRLREALAHIVEYNEEKHRSLMFDADDYRLGSQSIAREALEGGA